MIHFTGSTDPGDPTRSGESDEIPCMICGGYGNLAVMGNLDKICNDCVSKYVRKEIDNWGDAHCNGYMISENIIDGFQHGYEFYHLAHPSESFVDSFEEGMKKILK